VPQVKDSLATKSRLNTGRKIVASARNEAGNMEQTRHEIAVGGEPASVALQPAALAT
jgi:hypothetical protein